MKGDTADPSPSNTRIPIKTTTMIIGYIQYTFFSYMNRKNDRRTFSLLIAQMYNYSCILSGEKSFDEAAHP